MKRIILALFIIVSLIAVCSTAAYADTKYKYINGNIIRWRKPLLRICIDNEAYQIPDLSKAIDRSIALWESVPSSPRLYVGKYSLDNCQIFIKFDHIKDQWSYRPLAINVLSSYRNGELSYSTITFNKYYSGEFGDATKNKSVYDLFSVLSHEMGHALGLEEEYEDLKSIMYEKFEIGSATKRNLHRSDIRSITNLYGDLFPYKG
jgi:hypothetical protein